MIKRVPYEKGEQPCENFSSKNESPYFSGNEHQCYKCKDDTCVSYCENCHTDHHENGYETCKGRAK